MHSTAITGKLITIRNECSELADIDTDNRLLLISPFKNAQEAMDYVDHTSQ